MRGRLIGRAEGRVAHADRGDWIGLRPSRLNLLMSTSDLRKFAPTRRAAADAPAGGVITATGLLAAEGQKRASWRRRWLSLCRPPSGLARPSGRGCRWHRRGRDAHDDGGRRADDCAVPAPVNWSRRYRRHPLGLRLSPTPCFSIQISHAFFPTHSAYGGLMLSLATTARASSPGRSARWSSAYADQAVFRYDGRRSSCSPTFRPMRPSGSPRPSWRSAGAYGARASRSAAGRAHHRLPAGERAPGPAWLRGLVAGGEQNIAAALKAGSSRSACRASWPRGARQLRPGGSPSCSAPRPRRSGCGSGRAARRPAPRTRPPRTAWAAASSSWSASTAHHRPDPGGLAAACPAPTSSTTWSPTAQTTLPEARGQRVVLSRSSNAGGRQNALENGLCDQIDWRPLLIFPNLAYRSWSLPLCSGSSPRAARPHPGGHNHDLRIPQRPERRALYSTATSFAQADRQAGLYATVYASTHGNVSAAPAAHRHPGRSRDHRQPDIAGRKRSPPPRSAGWRSR